jgi:DHA2 family multidrug resistance protein
MAPRGLGSFLGMPAVGFLIAKLDSRRLVAGGLIAAGLTLIWLGHLNLNAGYWDIFWPQFLQGLGMSMVFVPLTTISMDPIPRERMGNATSLFNLMRNLGGGIGIATTTTLLARRSQSTAAILGANVTAYSPAARSTFRAAREAFIRAGSDPVTATSRAYAAMSGMVHRQATMVAFVEIFTLLGVIFLCLVPLVFIMKRPRGKAPVAAH